MTHGLANILSSIRNMNKWEVLKYEYNAKNDEAAHTIWSPDRLIRNRYATRLLDS